MVRKTEEQDKWSYSQSSTIQKDNGKLQHRQSTLLAGEAENVIYDEFLGETPTQRFDSCNEQAVCPGQKWTAPNCDTIFDPLRPP